MLNSYLGVFLKFRDFQGTSSRKEFNYYVLTYILFSILFVLIVFFGYQVAGIEISKLNKIGKVIIAVPKMIFDLVHFVPFVALVKRRINDIAEEKSKHFFAITCTSFVFDFLNIPILYCCEKYFKSDLMFAFLVILAFVVKIYLSIVILILMTKK